MKRLIDFIEQRSMLSHSENITEKQNFLIKGHTKDQNKIQYLNYVDLDLPSGLKWATCNIGAYKPEDPGLLFQWGRIDGYKYGDKNHKFLSVDDYVTTSGTRYKEADTLKPEDDAAYQSTNGRFRMSTTSETRELMGHTWHERAELNGVKGMKFVSKKDKSKWIFIPHAGRYDARDDSFGSDSYGFVWSSTAHAGKDNWAYYFWFGSSDGRNGDERRNGLSVRGVLNNK